MRGEESAAESESASQAEKRDRPEKDRLQKALAEEKDKYGKVHEAKRKLKDDYDRAKAEYCACLPRYS